MAKKICSQKSKVQIIRGNSDWGKILYSSCYVFNRNLADYWLSFADGEVLDSEKSIIEEIGRLESERTRLVEIGSLRASRKKQVSLELAGSRSRYLASKPIGEFVAGWNRYRNAQAGMDLVGMLENMGSAEAHRTAMQNRSKSLNDYVLAMDRSQCEEVGRDDRDCLRRAHTLLVKASALRKSLEMRRRPLAVPMSESRDEMYRFITSDEQTERLMGVCLNILKTYSEGDFFMMLTDCDRELAANYIYDAFSGFRHNYDFICGCYESCDDGKLRLKPFGVLSKKFYNGYYLTIRGFVQKAYVKARNENHRMTSLDATPEDGDDERDGYERFSDCQFPVRKSPETRIDEGMVEYWKDCRDFFVSKRREMALEFSRLLSETDCGMERASGDFQRIIAGVIDGLDRELSSGRCVKGKLKHIILDAMMGARTSEEWSSYASAIQRTIKKYLSIFFVNERILDEEDRNERLQEIGSGIECWPFSR